MEAPRSPAARFGRDLRIRIRRGSRRPRGFAQYQCLHEYKLETLKEAEACTEPGEIGALLRRKGLYSSHLSKWRQQRDEGVLAGLTPKKRGRKLRKVSAEARRVAELEREVALLRRKLAQAETIIEVQKKLSQLLGSQEEERS